MMDKGELMSETGKMPKERDTGVGVCFILCFLSVS